MLNFRPRWMAKWEYLVGVGYWGLEGGGLIDIEGLLGDHCGKTGIWMDESLMVYLAPRDCL